MNFSIIIPNLNGEKYLADCLPSLTASLKPISQKSKYEIILIDNNSTDDSIKVFSQTIGKLDNQIVQNKFNNGFSPSINQGIAASKYDWVILLNNDIVISPDWFEIVNKHIEVNTDKYAVYCGTVLTKDGKKYESLGLEFDYRGKCQNINNGQPYVENELTKKSIEIWGTSAAFAVYNKNILSEIGGFDSDFFAYEEDVDVALRLYLLGYKTLLIPTAICFHLGGGTSSKMNNFRHIMDVKNWFYIVIKDYPSKIIWHNLFNIFVERLRNFSGLTKTTIKMYGINSLYYLPLAYIKSYGQVLLNYPKMFAKRSEFQKLLSKKI